jgi:hypothetical protein
MTKSDIKSDSIKKDTVKDLLDKMILTCRSQRKLHISNRDQCKTLPRLLGEEDALQDVRKQIIGAKKK